MKTLARLLLFMLLLVVMVKVLDSDFDKTSDNNQTIVALKSE